MSSRRRNTLTVDGFVYSRFTALLVMLFAMLIILPVLTGDQQAMVAMRWFFSLTVLTGIYAGSNNWRDVLPALLLAIPAGVGRWTPQFHHNLTIFTCVTIVTILFLVYISATILGQVARAREVTYDTVCGALSCYLQAGFSWAFIYSLIETLNAGAFSFPATTPAYVGPDLQLRSQFLKFVYYSFTTITTAGYGDILPVSPPARGISIVEAIIGQFYIAVMIARLVSLQVTHSDRGRHDDAA